MNCMECNSDMIMYVSAKCSDLCIVEFQGVEHDGYVPYDLNIGGGDYIEIEVCMNCGQLQGEWPKDNIIEKMGQE